MSKALHDDREALSSGTLKSYVPSTNEYVLAGIFSHTLIDVVVANFAGECRQRVWAAASPDARWIFCVNEGAHRQVMDYADTTYAFYNVDHVLEVVRRNRECHLMRCTEYYDCNGNTRRPTSSEKLPVLPRFLKVAAAFSGHMSSVARCRWLPATPQNDDPVLCISARKRSPMREGVRIRRPATREEACEPLLRDGDSGTDREAEEKALRLLPLRDYTTTYAPEYVPFAAKTRLREIFAAERTLLPGVVTIVCAYMDHLAALRRVASPWIHSLRDCTSCQDVYEMSDMRRCDSCENHVCADDYEEGATDDDRDLCGHCASELEGEEEERRQAEAAEETEDGDDDVEG